MTQYRGPLRDGPLAIELHNTRYADAGAIVDALDHASPAAAWLEGIAARVPVGGIGLDPTADELRALREPVRNALQKLTEGSFPERETLEAINAFSRRAPVARVARWRHGAGPAVELDVAGASRADIVLSALAADAVELLTGREIGEIRACGAPGCVLIFLRSHPRREWCCAACGNRARQARHYARTRAG